jgi:hypothetical protein
MRTVPIGTVTLGTVVLGAVTLTSCGGSSSVDRADYVHQVCTSISSFEIALAAGTQALSTATTSAADNPATIKSAVGTQLAEERAAAATLSARLASAGYPEGNGGRTLARTLTNAARTTAKLYAAQPPKLAQVRTTDTRTLTTDLTAISTALQRGGDQLATEVNRATELGDSKTDQAFTGDSTCRGL